MALTFDDGPDPLGTPAVLAALRELGWTATFFLLGSQVRRYPDVARAVLAAGHEIALHGDEHRNHLFRPAGWVAPRPRRGRRRRSRRPPGCGRAGTGRPTASCPAGTLRADRRPGPHPGALDGVGA